MTALHVELREFTPEDYSMVSGWGKGHGNPNAIPALEYLPPIGQIAYETNGTTKTDVAAAWLYLAMASPVCFLECGVTCPGISLKRAKAAFIAMKTSLSAAAKSLGYQVMITHCSPAMSRVSKSHGWHQGAEKLTAMWAKI